MKKGILHKELCGDMSCFLVPSFVAVNSNNNNNTFSIVLFLAERAKGVVFFVFVLHTCAYSNLNLITCYTHAIR